MVLRSGPARGAVGLDVNAMEPIGTAAEVQASLEIPATEGGTAAPTSLFVERRALTKRRNI